MIDKFRAQRILEDGTRREMTDQEGDVNLEYDGEIISISAQKLASIMKIRFFPTRQCLQEIGNAVNEGAEEGILLGWVTSSHSSLSSSSFMLNPEKLEKIAQGPNPAMVSKRQGITLLEVSDMAAGGDKKPQCFFNAAKLAKAKLNFIQLKNDKRFQIVGSGEEQLAVIDREVLEGIAGMNWAAAKAQRDSRDGMDFIRS